MHFFDNILRVRHWTIFGCRRLALLLGGKFRLLQKERVESWIFLKSQTVAFGAVDQNFESRDRKMHMNFDCLMSIV